MRVVLVGGSGYIGSRLAARLTANGHDVSNISRTGRGTASVPGFTYGHMQRLFEGADVVVNLAGADLGDKRWSFQRKKEIVSSRLDVTRQVAETLHACKDVPALVSMSAAGYYGNTLLPSNEAMPHGNTFLAQLCYEWEQTALVAQSVTRVAIARMGVILDPSHGMLPTLVPPMRFFIGGPLGRGTQYVPWIHHADAIEGLYWLVCQPNTYGPYNIVAPDPVNWRQFSKTLGSVLHRPSCVRIPELPLRLMIGKKADVVVAGQYLVPQRLLNPSFTFKYPSLRGALTDLLS